MTEPMDFNNIEQWLQSQAEGLGIDPDNTLALIFMANLANLAQMQHSQYMATLGLIDAVLNEREEE